MLLIASIVVMHKSSYYSFLMYFVLLQVILLEMVQNIIASVFFISHPPPAFEIITELIVFGLISPLVKGIFLSIVFLTLFFYKGKLSVVREFRKGIIFLAII